MLCTLPDSWGDPFPNPSPEWDLIIASDILLCKLPLFYSSSIKCYLNGVNCYMFGFAISELMISFRRRFVF